MSVGFRVFLQRKLPEENVVEGLCELPAANIADVMGRSCAMSSEIRKLTPRSEKNMAGLP